MSIDFRCMKRISSPRPGIPPLNNVSLPYEAVVAKTDLHGHQIRLARLLSKTSISRVQFFAGIPRPPLGGPPRPAVVNVSVMYYSLCFVSRNAIYQKVACNGLSGVSLIQSIPPNP
jgi:hypothetical protein